MFAQAGCIACHGVEGRGGHPNNNVPGGRIPALRDVLATYTEKELQSKIRRGVRPEKLDPSGAQPLVFMPAWGEVLSENEIVQIARYLLSLAARDSPMEW